jgi:hypothetical protein
MADGMPPAIRKRKSEQYKVRPIKRAFRNAFPPSSLRGAIYKRHNQPPRNGNAKALTRRQRLEAEREARIRRLRPGSNSLHS